jgi:hypothetical protein
MKKLLCIGLLAAALFAPTPAQAWEYGHCKVNGGIKIYLNIQTPPATLPLAPWYLYFPAEAANQPVGPAGYYPNWAPQQPPGGAVTPPAPPPMPPPMPPAQPQPIQQTGYYTISSQPTQAPPYWYAR